MSNADETRSNILAQGLMFIILVVFMIEFTGCASTMIAPNGDGGYEARMESTTVLGMGTDYAERVNGSMQVNPSTQMELDEAVQQYGGGTTQ